MGLTAIPLSVWAAAPPVISDIPYLGADRAEKMDAYLPSDAFRRPVPAVLLIHGGGWKKGDKADNRERKIGAALAGEGYAVFSINYLLNQKENPDGTGRLVRLAWPQNLHDCKSALRYIRRHAAQYGVDPEEIAVMGGSAGGSFAMLMGATGDVAELNAGGLYPEEDNHVKCIIDFYGIPEITGQWKHSFTGPTKAETEKNSRAASATTYFSKDTPPILIAHGTADAVVPVQVSRDLAARLKELGVDCTYVEVPDAPHTFALQPPAMNLLPVLTGFLQTHMKKPERQ
jgi:acetyl esterase/lipase